MARPLYEGHRLTRRISKFLWLPKIINGKLRWRIWVTLRQKTVVKSMGLANYLAWENDGYEIAGEENE